MSSSAAYNQTTNSSPIDTSNKSIGSNVQNAKLPTSDGLRAPAGGLLRGATDDNGQLKTAALLVGIKLDLEAEIHLTARIKGDITIGLY